MNPPERAQALDSIESAAPDPYPRRLGDLWKPGIGRWLLLLILLASSLITLMLTSLQLYLDYRRDVDGIEARMNEVERSNLDALAASLWKLDSEQLRLQLDGIMRLPDMAAAELREASTPGRESLDIRVGQDSTHRVMTREMPIVYRDRDATRVLGTLRVVATLDGVYDRLIEKTTVILVSQGIKTFLVSFFILFIVHWVVTRHLTALATQVSEFDPLRPHESIRLHRNPRKLPDELDQLVRAFAQLQERLARTYGDLFDSNMRLQNDIAARQSAEREVQLLNAELENRVQLRTAELEATNRELAAFSYSVSHDLRAPLRAITGFSDLLERECAGRMNSSEKHYLERVRTGAQRMEALIADLLRLSQITQHEMKPTEIDLSALATEIAAALQVEAPERKAVWTIAPGIVARGDAGLLRVALENLIGNAWKYTAKREEAQIEFGRDDSNGVPSYFVRDNGAGFDMKQADKLFVAFQRLHSPAEFPGNGIGLATVARIVHRHGGNVRAESTLGQGSTFFFSLRV